MTRSLLVPGCDTVLNTPELTLVCLGKLVTMAQLEELDMSGASLDEDCHKRILKLRRILSLKLNNCKLSTIQTLQILTGLPNIRSLGKLFVGII